MQKKHLNFWQIMTMNFGFFGVQFSFGLQQSNMSAIYKYLGAEESELPLLWLAGPVTGLLVQPIIGAISDGTWSPKFGRRKPFFLIGAVIASLALIAMPYSSSIWMAAGLLWILDLLEFSFCLNFTHDIIPYFLTLFYPFCNRHHIVNTSIKS